MKKKQAISLFNGVPNMAKALGITTQTIRNWDDILTQKQVDRVRGAYMRLDQERTEKAQEILDACFVRSYTGKPVK